MKQIPNPYEDAYFTLFFDYLDDMNGVFLSETLHSGSQESVKSIKKAIKKNTQRKILRVASRSACLLFVLLLGAATTVLSVDAFRVPLFNAMFNRQERATSVRLQEKTQFEQAGYQIKEPLSLPSGYVYQRMIDNPLSYTVIYGNRDGDELIYIQHAPSYADTLDTEDAQTQSFIKIKERSGVYIEKNGLRTIYWKDDTSVYTIIGVESLDKLVKMAESVKAVDINQ